MKSILFNSEAVRAILDGRKSVTRRVVKPHPAEEDHSPYEGVGGRVCFRIGERACTDPHKPPCRPGNILYVRETWMKTPQAYAYKADKFNYDPPEHLWRPSIHMPKEAARLFLRVTNVRVERLQSITPEQVDAEGCKEWAYSAQTGELLPSSPSWFRVRWDSTIKKADLPRYGWSANPWVWVIEFEKITKEEAMKE